jgi:peptide-methionine (S)-S-oxide reductase
MRSKLLFTIAGAALVAGFIARSSHADALDKVIPAPAVDSPAAPAKHTEVAVLAGGCFWGMQGMFQHVDGVTKVVSGYSGGEKATATYDQVTTETTGHAEAVEITFDPTKVSYGELLRLYFSVAHDPTELNRQGPDSGPSYRSEIFFASPSQERVARTYIAQLQKAGVFDDPIVTKVEPLKAFYAAEGYHQDFLIHNPTHPYIVRNDLPKVAALKRLYPQMYRDKPVTVGR